MSGKIVQIIGPVIDVEFDGETLPNIYDALIVDDANLTLEVQLGCRQPMCRRVI